LVAVSRKAKAMTRVRVDERMFVIFLRFSVGFDGRR